MDKKKILKIVMCVILVIVFVVIIYFARNYIIISKIASMQEEIMKKDNYSYTLEFYPEEDYSAKTTVKYSFEDEKCTTEFDGEVVGRGNTEEQWKSFIPYAGISIKDKIDTSLRSYIYSAEINGQKCYVIKEVYGIVGWLYYYSKDDGTLVRQSSGHVKDIETEIKIVDYKYTFNE